MTKYSQIFFPAEDVSMSACHMKDTADASIHEVATGDSIFCYEDDDIDKAVWLMAKHQVRCLFVIDIYDRLVGIIFQGDIAMRVKKAKKALDVIQKISRPPTSQYQYQMEYAV